MTDLPKGIESPAMDHRQNDTDLLLLIQVDPLAVVEGVAVNDGYFAEDIVLTGRMRETCPVCHSVHLKLVLRQDNVKRAHMFCEQCTRCFDACFQDGTPVFSVA